MAALFMFLNYWTCRAFAFSLMTYILAVKISPLSLLIERRGISPNARLIMTGQKYIWIYIFKINITKHIHTKLVQNPNQSNVERLVTSSAYDYGERGRK